MSEIHFKTTTIKHRKARQDGTVDYKTSVGIFLYNESTTQEVGPLPISIVTKAWPSMKPQPLYMNVTKIVRFLNYIYFECETPVASMDEITPDHVLNFLTDISATSGRRYVTLTENVLSKSLYFLWKHGMLTGFKESDFIVVPTRHGSTIFIDAVHDCYTLPADETQPRLHDMDTSVAITMLELAMRYTPRIALGVYIEIFGGVRRSEVISLEYDRLRFNYGGNNAAIVVELKNSDLRPDLRLGYLAKAKIPREQEVIYVQQLFDPIYRMNQEFTAKTPTNAVIVNANGDPMTEASYSRYFRKLRAKLIETLKDSPNFDLRSYGATLESAKWSTHICRGIYSNLIARAASTSAEIARARGDNSLDSSLPYLADNDKVRDQIIDTVEDIIRNRPLHLGDSND